MIRRIARTALARVLARATVALAADPGPHGKAVLAQGGFTALCDLLSTCETDAAARVLRQFGATVGARPMIHSGLRIVNAEGTYSNLRIGDGCHIGPGVLLDLTSSIQIGDRVAISMRSMLLTHFNAGESMSQRANDLRGAAAIFVNSDAYIGAGAILLPGVTIGEGAVVGAGAVVTRDVRPGTVVVGIPARPVHE